MTGREMYEQRCPYSRAWEDLTAVDRRWWNLQAAKPARPPLTWPQRLAIWAAVWLVVTGAISALVGLVWYLVSRW